MLKKIAICAVIGFAAAWAYQIVKKNYFTSLP